jgi:hypothetical protein
VVRTALANSPDRFKLAIRRLIDGMMVEQVADNDQFVTRWLGDRELSDVGFASFAPLRSYPGGRPSRRHVVHGRQRANGAFRGPFDSIHLIERK